MHNFQYTRNLNPSKFEDTRLKKYALSKILLLSTPPLPVFKRIQIPPDKSYQKSASKIYK